MYANLDQPNLSPRTTGWENAAMTTSTGRLTALQASWLFDGTGSALISDPVVLIEGSTIRGVSSGGSPPRGATVIDLSGATLLPGLVDTHVHLAFDTSADASPPSAIWVTAATCHSGCAARPACRRSSPPGRRSPRPPGTATTWAGPRSPPSREW